MLISVGNGRFIQKTSDSDSYKIVVITGQKWNAACECYDSVYSPTHWFETYNDALNFAYGKGKRSVDRREIDAEIEQARAIALRIGG